MTHTFDPQILIRLRKAQFWTQEDLSAASGVSVRTIQRIEREGGGSLESWKGLAAAFDVPVKTFQFVYAKQSYSLAEKRRAIIGVSLGCFGGFFGCAVSWWSIMQIPSEDLSSYPIMIAYVSFATAILFIAPIWTWRRLK